MEPGQHSRDVAATERRIDVLRELNIAHNELLVLAVCDNNTS
jgi:hypothetical protein